MYIGVKDQPKSWLIEVDGTGNLLFKAWSGTAYVEKGKFTA
jgi:hypothetical protein